MKYNEKMEDHEIENNEISFESLYKKLRCQIKLNKIIKQEVFKIMEKLYDVNFYLLPNAIKSDKNEIFYNFLKQELTQFVKVIKVDCF